MQLHIHIQNAGLYISRFKIVNKKKEEKLQHRSDVVGDGEWRLGLRLDFLHRHALSELDQRQAVCKVDIEDALLARSVNQ